VPKNTIINIRVDNDLKKQAKKLAADENRSLSNWVTWLIRREIKRKDGKR
jgi:predicted HicB family RNase H-like nuclease